MRQEGSRLLSCFPPLWYIIDWECKRVLLTWKYCRKHNCALFMPTLFSLAYYTTQYIAATRTWLQPSPVFKVKLTFGSYYKHHKRATPRRRGSTTIFRLWRWHEHRWRLVGRKDFPFCASKHIKPSPWLLVRPAYQECMTGSSIYRTTACFMVGLPHGQCTWEATGISKIYFRDRRESSVSDLTSALKENLFKSEKVNRDIWTHIHHRSNNKVNNLLA